MTSIAPDADAPDDVPKIGRWQAATVLDIKPETAQRQDVPTLPSGTGAVHGGPALPRPAHRTRWLFRAAVLFGRDATGQRQ